MKRVAALLVLAAICDGSLAQAQTAPTSVTDCDRRARHEPALLESYRCYWLMARQNRAQEGASRLAAMLDADPRNHRARLYLARIEGDRGNDAAESLFRDALLGFRATGDPEGQTFTHLAFGLFLARRGRGAEADAQVAGASTVAEASGVPVLTAWAKSEAGWQAYRKGDYALGWRLFKEVEAQVFPDGPLALRASCLSGLGAMTWAMGRISESVEYQRLAADLNHQDGDFYDEARARGNLTLLAFRLAMDGEMEQEEVVTRARQALDAAIAGANPGTEARAHLYLGDLTSGPEARSHYRASVAISRRVKEVSGISLGLRGLAMNLVEAEPRDPEMAYAYAEEALQLARGSGDFFLAALASAAVAHMRWITGPREQAIADSLSALSAIEAIRDLQQDGLARARVFGGWTFAYERLAGHLLERMAGDPPLADLELAFAVTERMRARVLLDELDAAQASGIPTGPFVDQRNAILASIAQAQRALINPALPDSARSRTLSELERLELEEERFRVEIARTNPAFGVVRNPTLSTLNDLAHVLESDEAVVAFHVSARMNLDNRRTDDGSWVWVLTRAATRVYPIPDLNRLKPALALFLGLLQRRDGSDLPAARRLYQDLLGTALGELPPGIRRLVIVPDDVLNQLPFHALQSPEDREPLAARFQIFLVPSTTLWLRWKQDRVMPAEVPALALADPSLSPEGARMGAERQWALATGVPWTQLPFARKEAEFLVRHLGQDSRLFVGDEATEHRLKQTDLRRYAVLHLAAHAAIDDEHPDRSAVLLAAGSNREDGLLQPREIVALDLKSRLVVLSACRSASGAVLGGEGVMGLARAFFQAGARTVVASLWPLRDAEAADLFESFYRHLNEGHTVAAALAAAQRDRLRRGVPAAAWAGLVVLGDGDLVPIPRAASGGGVRGVTGAFGVSLLVVALVVIARRKLARS